MSVMNLPYTPLTSHKTGTFSCVQPVCEGNFYWVAGALRVKSVFIVTCPDELMELSYM